MSKITVQQLNDEVKGHEKYEVFLSYLSYRGHVSPNTHRALNWYVEDDDVIFWKKIISGDYDNCSKEFWEKVAEGWGIGADDFTEN